MWIGRLMRYIFYLIFIIFFTFNTYSDAVETDAKPIPLADTESASSALVSNCVNVITGDYVESSNDLVLFGPEPLVFERFYSSSDYKTKSFFDGWRHNLDSYVKIYNMPPCEHRGAHLRFLYLDTSGRTTFHSGYTMSDHIVRARIDMKLDSHGLTNYGGGVISGRTNPKNVEVIFHEKSGMVDATTAEGGYRQFTCQRGFWGETFHLIHEKKTNGHQIIYDYDKEYKVTEVKTTIQQEM
jgi:hypothetical protein